MIRTIRGIEWTRSDGGWFCDMAGTRWTAEALTSGDGRVRMFSLYRGSERIDANGTTLAALTKAVRRAAMAYPPAPMPKGRPPDDEAKREVKVQIRAMATQRAAWHAAAALAGKDLSEWLRDLADEAARRAR